MTLNQIVDDILLTCFYIDREKTEKIQRRQVEAWVHQYRLLLLKQEISKNSVVDPSYISYRGVDMKQVREQDPITLTVYAPEDGVFQYESIDDLPELAPLIGRLGLTSVVVFGETMPRTPVTVGDISRNMYARYDYWNKEKLVATMYGNKLRVIRFDTHFNPAVDAPITGIFLKARCGMILANPSTMVQTLEGDDFREEEYPIPVDRIPRLKSMIYASELQWLMPARDTAQSAQMAKMEEQELHNNPAALMQAGADLYDGFQ